MKIIIEFILLLLIFTFNSCKQKNRLVTSTVSSNNTTSTITITSERIVTLKTDATLSGDSFDFDTLKGKYVLIDFWGTWCAPCVKEMPRIKDFHESFNDKLYVLGINQGDSKARVRQFITSNEYSWTQIINGAGSSDFVLKFNVISFPTKLIVDPQGNILHRFVGGSEKVFNKLSELLRE